MICKSTEAVAWLLVSIQKEQKNGETTDSQDEPPIVNSLEKFMAEKNYDVVTASNEEETLEEFHRENPNIVLLNIHMPGKHGIEALKELKQVNPDVGVVMITGIADDIDRSTLKLEALDYIAHISFRHPMSGSRLGKRADRGTFDTMTA